MEPKPNTSPAAGGIVRCPHLGLHDDPATALAYPSAWNYCYRANPPASILNSHQSETCLGAGYQRCPIYLRAERGPMPSYLQGSNSLAVTNDAPPRGRAWLIAALLLLITIALVAVFIPRSLLPGELFPSPAPSLTLPTFTPRPTLTRTPTRAYLDPNAGIIASFTAEAQTRIANYTATLNPTDFAGAQTAARAATLTPPTKTPSSTTTPSPTRTPSLTPTFTASPRPSPTLSRTPTPVPGTLPPADRFCGHELDTPFGKERQFVIHRVMTGENLDYYANTYRTTTDAIIAINYLLPIPVWADSIVVLPAGFSDVTGIPPFEPHFEDRNRTSIEELAVQLNTDLGLLRKYNAFDEPCGTFTGWLLVPRPAP